MFSTLLTSANVCRIGYRSSFCPTPPVQTLPLLICRSLSGEAVKARIFCA